MTVVKKTKIPIKYFQISIFLNIITLAIVLWLLLRKRDKQSSRRSEANTPAQSQSLGQIQINTAFRKKHNEQTQSYHIQQSIVKKVQKLEKVHYQADQIVHKSSMETTQQFINILQEQLQLQRNQNELLQQKNRLLQEQIKKLTLNTVKNQESQQITNLKNELQFCQMRLIESIKNQNILQSKLADYERMSISMLNHPQYHRLRQLNNAYKDTISKLQNQLLNRHQYKNHYVDLSFNL